MPAPGASAPRREQYALVGVIERLLVANGVRTDLETALFDVDHGIQLGRALAPRAAGATRGAQASTETTSSAGRSPATDAAPRRCPTRSRALRLGTLDALKFFHRGMIERCLGHDSDARGWFERALRLNPQFSLLWSPVARRYASMKRCSLLLAAVAALARPGGALAHPLGNFTVNRFSAVELSGDRVYVKYVLDMAEIPTFQEAGDRRRRRRTRSQAGSARGLRLSVDGRPVALTPLAHALAFPPGAGGLRTLRFEAVFASPPLDGADAARVPRHELRAAGSAGRRSSSGPSAARGSSPRPCRRRSVEPRAARVPEGSPARAPRRHRGAGELEPGRRRAPPALPRASALHTRRPFAKPGKAASRA